MNGPDGFGRDREPPNPPPQNRPDQRSMHMAISSNLVQFKLPLRRRSKLMCIQRRFVARGHGSSSFFWLLARMRRRRRQSTDRRLLLVFASFLQLHFWPIRFRTMGKKRPRRGQNGSGKRLFCPLAVTIVVLVATYWYGGEDDAATHSKGKCEPSPASTRRSQSAKTKVLAVQEVFVSP